MIEDAKRKDNESWLETIVAGFCLDESFATRPCIREVARILQDLRRPEISSSEPLLLEP